MPSFLVSAIITTKNEIEIIERNLKSLKRQTHPRIETIVVDNNSSDGTVEVAQKCPNKVLTFGPERSAQRNFGTKKTRGKYLKIGQESKVIREASSKCTCLG